MSAALTLAVLRGVDVRLLLPSRPDHYVVYAASSLYAFDAVRAGVRVFRYEPGFLHQKVVLVDNDITAIGSANLDMLTADFAAAREISLQESHETRRLHQLGMRVARLISPIL
ncbi:Cardiolipin synthase A [Pseudomonas syringae pv. maculicola]|uniref:Cardiolipin synthase A n=1 Tax=Pseudomonas syringae pv. maculicola TaxID=59511 RepID=A0A3M2WIZ5_PSEYM|nr:Cardiolipin synthase A [Pseudomonas syringae pv. maculicola]